MIKNLFAGLYASLVVGSALVFGSGCGAEAEDFDEEQDEDQPAEIGEYGQVSEAMTRPVGYGWMQPLPPGADSSFGGKCPATWTTAYRCTVPNDKTLRFKNDLPQVPPFTAPVDFRGLFQQVINYYQGQFPGWVIATGGTDATENVKLYAGSTQCGPNLPAACAVPVFGTLFTEGGLTYKRINRCRIAIQYENTNWMSMTATQRETRAWNMLLHEVGHCLGVAHPDFVAPPHPELGVMYGPNSSNINAYSDLTSAEKSQINAYVP